MNEKTIPDNLRVSRLYEGLPTSQNRHHDFEAESTYHHATPGVTHTWHPTSPSVYHQSVHSYSLYPRWGIVGYTTGNIPQL
jgi:hypothetical protein